MPMKLLWHFLAAAIALAVSGGCATDSIKGATDSIKGVFQTKGEQELSAGIRSYEDGKYGEASKSLQTALDAGLNNPDQVRAHKYLAFMHCASGREKQCRDEFRKALDINPALELEPAEAGHPIWGPVFRSVKARR
jgi:Tfp pilus assembly protein PilF